MHVFLSIYPVAASRGAWGICPPPPHGSATHFPPPPSEGKNGQNQPFSAFFFFEFCPLVIAFCPLARGPQAPQNSGAATAYTPANLEDNTQCNNDILHGCILMLFVLSSVDSTLKRVIFSR